MHVRGNMHRYGWRQWDGEMPKGDMQSEMNDECLAAFPFRRDLFFISVLLVNFPAPSSLGRSHLWHFVLICVCKGRERED